MDAVGFNKGAVKLIGVFFANLKWASVLAKFDTDRQRTKMEKIDCVYL